MYDATVTQVGFETFMIACSFFFLLYLRLFYNTGIIL